ncbi:hypothetical protein GCM10018966_065090 [Streptomyces yanii]
MRPTVVVEFPDPGVRLPVAGGDRVGGGERGVPAVGVEPVVAGGGGEQQQAFAEDIELELAVDAVADDIEAARVAGQVEPALVGHRGPGDGVGGGERWPVLKEAGSGEQHGVVQQRVGSGGGDGLADVGLIADPHVPVVVVAALLHALRQAGGGRGDRAAAGAGEAGQDRVGVPGIALPDGVRKIGHARRPASFGSPPQHIGRLGRRQGPVGDFQDEVEVLAGLQAHRSAQRRIARADVTRAAEAHLQLAGPGREPVLLVAAQLAQRVDAEAGRRAQVDIEAGVTVDGQDPAQHDGAVLIARVGERFSAFDDAARGDPAAAPDEAARLVVSAPDERVGGGDGVPAVAADQGSEDGVTVPGGCAHPYDVAARSDQGAAPAVSEQGVVAQGMRGGRAISRCGQRAISHRGKPGGSPCFGGCRPDGRASAACARIEAWADVLLDLSMFEEVTGDDQDQGGQTSHAAAPAASAGSAYPLGPPAAVLTEDTVRAYALVGRGWRPAPVRCGHGTAPRPRVGRSDPVPALRPAPGAQIRRPG